MSLIIDDGEDFARERGRSSLEVQESRNRAHGFDVFIGNEGIDYLLGPGVWLAAQAETGHRNGKVCFFFEDIDAIEDLFECELGNRAIDVYTDRCAEDI